MSDGGKFLMLESSEMSIRSTIILSLRKQLHQAADQSVVFWLRTNRNPKMTRRESLKVLAGANDDLLFDDQSVPEQSGIHLCREPQQKKVCG